MKTVRQIQEQFRDAHIDLTDHSRQRALVRNISNRELVEAGSMATLVEEYTERPYGPSALLFGITEGGRPLHIVVALSDSPRVLVVTAYDPDPTEWRSFWTRREL